MKWYKLNGGYFSEDFEFFKEQVHHYELNGKKVIRPKIFYHSFVHHSDSIQETHKLLKEGKLGTIEIIEKDFEDFWETTTQQVQFKDPLVQAKVNHLALTLIYCNSGNAGVEFWDPHDDWFMGAPTDKEYEKYVEKCKLDGTKPQSNKWQKKKGIYQRRV